ncbi:hypothetical protein PENPOL_c003G00608 [Penicillium polonicum]|uniref:Uncharacterized protein n=1 Tax=Penicillium polonicum TaxID=60169 RepID=A0A1V6NTV1_PENPO|nr:hypothetical protein PENPOL_c003G00608 [Penicillium polonicum]
MSRDADFLSPRDLLVNDNFCLNLTSFRKLLNVIKETEGLPSDDESLRQKIGFWEKGYQILYIYLNPIAQQFMIVRQVAACLDGEFKYTATVCDTALTLCASAPADYDKIFTGIEALRRDPENAILRDDVLKDIKDRQNLVQILRDRATGWSSDLRSYTLQAGDCEVVLRNLAVPFKGSALCDRLTSEDDPSCLQDDLHCLGKVPGLLEDFSMMEDIGASLQEVEKMAGSASLIAVDVQSLVDYIAKHVDPDHNPLEGLVKRKLLDKWATLQKHGKQADMLILFIPFALLVSF